MRLGVDSGFEDLLIAYNRADSAERKQSIEKQIWSQFGIEASVLVLDMSGFSLLSQRHGIIHYLSMIRRMQLTALPIVESHEGRVIKFEADNCFAVFTGPMQAARAAITLNHAFAASNLITVDELDIRVGCGIDHGRILLLNERDLFGHPVNRASKLGEDVAESGEVLITAEAFSQIPTAAQIRGKAIELTIAGIVMEAVALQY
jgi:class 3 adenylate cyclase